MKTILSLCVSLFWIGELRSEDLLTLVKEANQSAIGSIKTMSCLYKRFPWRDATGEVRENTGLEGVVYRYNWSLYSPGAFWRSGPTYRIQLYTQPGHLVDSLVKDYSTGVFLNLNRDFKLGVKDILAWVALTPVDGEGGLLWQWLLFTHWGRMKAMSYYTFADILLQPHKINQVSRLDDGLVYVSLSHDLSKVELWFDPNANYLVRKQKMSPSEYKDVIWEDEVINFETFPNNVCVPSVIEHRCFRKGQPDGALRTILEKLKVNEPISNEDLRIPKISGMICYDMVHKLKFTVDADGNRVGPATPYEIARVGPTKKPLQPKDDPPPSWYPTRQIKVWNLISNFCLLLLIVALGVKLWNDYKLRS